MFSFFSISHEKNRFAIRQGAMTLLAVVLFFSSCSTGRKAIRDAQRNIPSDFYHVNSQKLGYRLSGKENPVLIEEAAAWIGVPYRFAGMSRQGADCSGFVWSVYRHVYQLNLPRSTEDMARAGRKIRKRRLSEGDLVFFRINKGRKVSHVGVYLGNNKFIHASTSRGVIVSDLDEPYYSQRFQHGGRVSGGRR